MKQHSKQAKKKIATVQKESELLLYRLDEISGQFVSFSWRRADKGIRACVSGCRIWLAVCQNQKTRTQ
jgi:hypothetical protein